MYYLFSNRRDFNEDISRWNVSNVGNMSNMLFGATSFNGHLSRWEAGQVETMVEMFLRATLL